MYKNYIDHLRSYDIQFSERKALQILVIIIVFLNFTGLGDFIPFHITSFLGSLFYYIIPTILGAMILSLFKNKKFNDNSLVKFFIGTLSLMILSALLMILNLFSLNYLILLIIIFSLIYTYKGSDIQHSINIYPHFLTFFLASIIFTILRIKSPFPLSPDWDGFVYSYVGAQMKKFDLFYVFMNEYSDKVFQISELTRPHILLVSLASKVLHVEIYKINWWGPFTNYYLYIYGLWLILSKFHRDELTIWIILFISVFFAEYYVAGAITFFSPATTLSIILIYTIFFYLQNKNDYIKLISFFLILFTFTLLWNAYIGVFYLGFTSIFLFSDKIIKIVTDKWSLETYKINIWINTIFIILIFLLLFTDTVFELNLDNILNALNLPNTSLNKLNKIIRINEHYTLNIFYFSIFMMIAYTIYKYFNKNEMPINPFITSYLITVTSYLGLSLPYIHRLIYLFKVYIPVILCIPYYILVQEENQSSIKLDKYFINKKHIIYAVYFVILINSYLNYSSFIDVNAAKGVNDTFSSITQEYVDTGAFLNSLEKKYYVIGEPCDQTIISGICGFDNFGGLTTSKESASLIKQIFSSVNEVEVYGYVEQLRIYEQVTSGKRIDLDDLLLIYSGRTESWLNSNDDIVYQPKKINDVSKIQNIFDKSIFENIYDSNNQIFIMRVNEPQTPFTEIKINVDTEKIGRNYGDYEKPLYAVTVEETESDLYIGLLEEDMEKLSLQFKDFEITIHHGYEKTPLRLIENSRYTYTGQIYGADGVWTRTHFYSSQPVWFEISNYTINDNVLVTDLELNFKVVETSSNINLRNSIIGKWTNQVIDNTIKDISYYNHSGILVGFEQDEHLANSLVFDGLNDHVIISDDLGGQVKSFEIWINPRKYVHSEVWYHILASKDDSFKYGLYMDYYHDPNRFVVICSNGVDDSISQYQIPKYDKIYQVVGVIANNKVSLYVDGKLIISGKVLEGEVVYKDLPLLIGGGLKDRYSSFGFYELTVYDKALNSREILWLYSEGSNKYRNTN